MDLTKCLWRVLIFRLTIHQDHHLYRAGISRETLAIINTQSTINTPSSCEIEQVRKMIIVSTEFQALHNCYLYPRENKDQ